MKNKLLSGILIIFVTVTLGACSKDDEAKKTSTKVEGRWYTTLQLTDGKQIFKNNCAICHGSEGQGLTEDWKKALPDGQYPPPPLL